MLYPNDPIAKMCEATIIEIKKKYDPLIELYQNKIDGIKIPPTEGKKTLWERFIYFWLLDDDDDDEIKGFVAAETFKPIETKKVILDKEELARKYASSIINFQYPYEVEIYEDYSSNAEKCKWLYVKIPNYRAIDSLKSQIRSLSDSAYGSQGNFTLINVETARDYDKDFKRMALENQLAETLKALNVHFRLKIDERLKNHKKVISISRDEE